MNIRELANLSPNYYEINREERNYAAILFAGLCMLHTSTQTHTKANQAFGVRSPQWIRRTKGGFQARPRKF